MTDVQTLTEAITCADCGEQVEEYRWKRCAPCFNRRADPSEAEIDRLVELYEMTGPNGEPSAAWRDFHRGDFKDYSEAS